MYLARGLGSARLTSGMARGGSWFRIKPQIKMQFFDRQIIRTRWPKMNRDPLMHAGNLVMRIARGSIKRRSYKTYSQPGRPPYSHANTKQNPKYQKIRYTKKGGQKARTPPFKQIFSVPYRFGTSVMVGMVGYTRTSTPVPGLHEHSGMARRKVFTNLGQRRKKSGQWGKSATSYKSKMVKYPQRPFMMPALMRARQRLPRLWLNSLGGSRL